MLFSVMPNKRLPQSKHSIKKKSHAFFGVSDQTNPMLFSVFPTKRIPCFFRRFRPNESLNPNIQQKQIPCFFRCFQPNKRIRYLSQCFQPNKPNKSIQPIRRGGPCVRPNASFSRGHFAKTQTQMPLERLSNSPCIRGPLSIWNKT